MRRWLVVTATMQASQLRHAIRHARRHWKQGQVDGAADGSRLGFVDRARAKPWDNGFAALPICRNLCFVTLIVVGLRRRHMLRRKSRCVSRQRFCHRHGFRRCVRRASLSRHTIHRGGRQRAWRGRPPGFQLATRAELWNLGTGCEGLGWLAAMYNGACL